MPAQGVILLSPPDSTTVCYRWIGAESRAVANAHSLLHAGRICALRQPVNEGAGVAVRPQRLKTTRSVRDRVPLCLLVEKHHPRVDAREADGQDPRVDGEHPAIAEVRVGEQADGLAVAQEQHAVDPAAVDGEAERPALTPPPAYEGR